MISKELKNDFREMIFGTFAAAFEDLIYSWEKKNISFGNGHFQKWVEIIFFKKMLHNLRKVDKLPKMADSDPVTIPVQFK